MQICQVFIISSLVTGKITAAKFFGGLSFLDIKGKEKAEESLT